MSDGALRGFGELILLRPGRQAPPTVVAEWYRRKAELFEDIAANGGPEAGEARNLAAAARQHAARLLADKVA
ncbi:hypothetical protein [Pseudonocardia sp. TRM90224]|uniref:hypothetical protein n=1 Tax=Pseudonocardia sp. TRM90224 TaxID=2812678 RepID=UPI001E4285D8|nr:hypothetical protein [Pseudonocardia sp. TRM90224]